MVVVSPPSQSLRRFFDFINERHFIFVRRAGGGHPPWTSDPILKKHRFTNVFRELDRVTVWIRENWREPYADHPNLWFAMAMARQINWPDTLADIGFPEKWQPRRVVHAIERRRIQGQKAYTSAYMLTGGWKGSKANWTVRGILDPLYRDPPSLHPDQSLEHAFHMFKGRPGFGPFLSYEVVTDLRHTRYLQDAPDIMTWANAGPGAIRGLHRVWGRPLKKRKRLVAVPRPEPERALAEMRLLLSASLVGYLGLHVPKLELRDIEHSLCEFDKYERARLGQGTLARYNPYVIQGGLSC